MNLSKNEKTVLKLLIENARASDAEIGRALKITPQAIGKIRKKLESEGIIKGYETRLDYPKMGINVMAIALFHFTAEARKTILTEDDVNERIKGPLIINFYRVPEGEVTHVVTYGFRTLEELDNYFHVLQTERGHISEIRQLFIFSAKSVRKNSDKELMLKVLEEHGKDMILARPIPGRDDADKPQLKRKMLTEMRNEPWVKED